MREGGAVGEREGERKRERSDLGPDTICGAEGAAVNKTSELSLWYCGEGE